jgi:hypothetical protein
MIMAWIAPIAVAAQRAEEEDALDELELEYGPQWEFKILRSMSHAFRDWEALAEALREEGQAGWEIARQIDSGRVILKRPLEARRNDHLLGPEIDPYREYYGRSHVVLVAAISGLLLIGILVLLLFMVIAR